MAKKHNNVSSRMAIIFFWLLFSVFGIYLCYALYQTSVVNHDKYAQLAASTQWRLHQYSAERGQIYDANGTLLAANSFDYTIAITPRNLHSSATSEQKATREQIISTFSSLLGVDPAELEEIIPVDPDDMNDPRNEVLGLDLARNVPKEIKEQLEAFVNQYEIGGISFIAVPQRYYTYGQFLSQVLGYAVNDGVSLRGIYGLEAYYNDVLYGTDGYRYAEVDAQTEGVLPYSEPTTVDPIDGNNLILNIDVNIQQIAEEACRRAYETYAPRDGVTAIVMDPYTGAVYAMVSLPDYDLNDPYATPYGMHEMLWDTMSSEEQVEYLLSNVWRNRCISDTYEPGSTFKALTTAIALEEGLTNENEVFSDAPIAVSEIDTISCWLQKSSGYNHGEETLIEAFQYSCNPIFVQLAYRIGVERYYEYVHSFGFYETTGIDLPAEGIGIFHEEPTSIDMASLSFGESSTVTPIQLLNSYCAIINGGDLMEPHIVRYITDQEGNIVDEIEPEVIRTIFSEETCARVRALMERVVLDGTGSAGSVPGYSVAGKTSTSTIEIGPMAGAHVLSFSCYAPSYAPEIAVLVVVNKPEDNSVGSSAAASTAAEIVERTLTYMGVERVFTEEEFDEMVIRYYVQPVSGMSAAQASSRIGANGISTIYGVPSMTSESIVSFTYPSIDATLYSTGIVVMYPEGVTQEEMLTTTVPNLEGKSAVECINALRDMNLNVYFEGDITGICSTQSIEAGSEVLAGEIITVTLGTDGGSVSVVPATPTPAPAPEGDTGTQEG